MFIMLLSFKNIHSWSFYNKFIIVFSALLGLVWWTDKCWMYLELRPPEISKTLCSNWTLNSPPCFHREATSNSVDVGWFRSHLDRIALSVCFPVTALLFLKNNSEVLRLCYENVEAWDRPQRAMRRVKCCAAQVHWDWLKWMRHIIYSNLMNLQTLVHCKKKKKKRKKSKHYMQQHSICYCICNVFILQVTCSPDPW